MQNFSERKTSCHASKNIYKEEVLNIVTGLEG
jgi:hypothetical protein